MEATGYLNNLIRGVTRVVEISALEKLKDKSFWDKDIDREDSIGAISFDRPIYCQSKELKKIGGVLRRKGTTSSVWYPPKGSCLYKLVWGKDSKQLYFLLCLKDGREILLKQTAKRLGLVDHLSPYAYHLLMLKFFQKLYGDEARIEKIIQKLSETGGYK